MTVPPVAWIHREALMANGQLAVNGEEVFEIDPLRLSSSKAANAVCLTSGLILGARVRAAAE